MLGALAKATPRIVIQNSLTEACRTRRNSLYNLSVTSQQTSNFQYPSGFQFWPHFLSEREQRVLLAASLQKLDATEARFSRRRRKKYFEDLGPLSKRNYMPAVNLFAPDALYEFQQGHFDGVIRHFREIHLSNWPFEDFEGLERVMGRIHSVCPTTDIQTHLLHLASYGDILPHVDNVFSSGSWILGVSLGDERVLRMQPLDENGHEFSVVLTSGSVYLQRDGVRFKYNHSIERPQSGDAGQRLSVMIRERRTAPF